MEPEHGDPKALMRIGKERLQDQDPKAAIKAFLAAIEEFSKEGLTWKINLGRAYERIAAAMISSQEGNHRGCAEATETAREILQETEP